MHPLEPALTARQLAGGRAELHIDGDHAVLMIETVIDNAVVDEIVAELTELAHHVPDGGRLHVDLRLAGVLAPKPLMRLVTAIRVDVDARCRLVADRLSTLLLLERWGIADDVSIVTEVP